MGGLRRAAFIAVACTCALSTAQAYDWTHWVDIATDTSNGRIYRAYMWLPPSCANGVRGLVMASHTSCEALFVRDPHVRAAAEAEQLAIIYYYPSLFSIIEPPEDTVDLLRSLDSLAEVSGRPEIRYAPWMGLGHSTSSHFAMGLGWWKTERAFAAMPYKGGIVPKPSWATGTMAYVPLLALNGEFEEYAPPEGSFQALRRDALNFRVRDPNRNLTGAMMATGEGHMGWSTRAAPLVGMFIRKAARRRIPAGAIAADGPVALNEVPGSAGWCADTNVFETKGNVRIDTAASFTNPRAALWLIDREFAETWLTFHSEVGARKRQQVNPQGKTPSVTPSVGFYYDPPQSVWRVSGAYIAQAYTVDGWASSGLPIDHIFAQTGPGYIDSAGQLRFDAANFVEDRQTRVILRQDGNAEYAPADRMLRFNMNLMSGTEQSVSVPDSVPVLMVGESWTMTARASSELPVTYHVQAGPAEVRDSMLTAMPFTSAQDTVEALVRAGQGGGYGFATAPIVEFRVRVARSALRGAARNTAKVQPWSIAYRRGMRAIEIRGWAGPPSVATIDIVDTLGRVILSRRLRLDSAAVRCRLPVLPPGRYVARVRGHGARVAFVVS